LTNHTLKKKNRFIWGGILSILVAIAFGGVFHAHSLAEQGDVASSPSQEAFVKGAEDFKEEVQHGILHDTLPIGSYRPIHSDLYQDMTITRAHASLVLDVDSGTLLHYQNGKERRSIASLTKIMTAVVIMENIDDLQEEVIITPEMIQVEGTIVGCPRTGYCIGNRLYAGEKITVENLLRAMLMNSANDAATALAIHTGGSLESFVKMMNVRAKELGLTDTNFCTPSGLEIDGREETCYSTAYDIARIAAHAIQFEEIWEIMQLPQTTIYSVDNAMSHEIMNTNRLLGEYPGLLGAKTGFTPLAGRSLLAVAKHPKEEHYVVAVLLDDPYRWQDIEEMLNWTFDSYTWQ